MFYLRLVALPSSELSDFLDTLFDLHEEAPPLLESKVNKMRYQIDTNSCHSQAF